MGRRWRVQGCRVVVSGDVPRIFPLIQLLAILIARIIVVTPLNGLHLDVWTQTLELNPCPDLIATPRKYQRSPGIGRAERGCFWWCSAWCVLLA